MRRIIGVLLLVVAALSGCDGGQDNGASPQASPSPTISIVPDIDPGILTAEPSLTEDFSAGPSGWTGGAVRAGRFAVSVPNGRDLGFAVAPERIAPGSTGVFLQARIDMPRRGRAGLFCRRSPDGRGGYAVIFDPAAGAWEVLRLERDEPEHVRGEALRPEVVRPGEDAFVRMLCGTGEPGEPVTIAFTINSSGLLGARDESALAVAGTSTAGVVVEGRGDRVRFDDVSLTLGE